MDKKRIVYFNNSFAEVNNRIAEVHNSIAEVSIWVAEVNNRIFDDKIPVFVFKN